MPSVPRLPLVGDPLRRVHVRRDLASITTTAAEADPAAVGLDSKAVDKMWHAARDLYRSGVHPALQLCVRRHGQVVIDRAIGHASGNGPDDDRDTEKVLVTTDTPFCVFSASKAMTAMVVHKLHERGLLDVDDRVADYIPEYAAHGKGDTTIAHVLAHRAGVPTLPRKALAVQPRAEVQQLADAPRLGQRAVPHVELDVELLVLDPDQLPGRLERPLGVLQEQRRDLLDVAHLVVEVRGVVPARALRLLEQLQPTHVHGHAAVLGHQEPDCGRVDRVDHVRTPR